MRGFWFYFGGFFWGGLVAEKRKKEVCSKNRCLTLFSKLLSDQTGSSYLSKFLFF